MKTTQERMVQLIRQTMIRDLSRRDVQDPEKVTRTVVQAVRDMVESEPEVLDYKIEVEDESPGVQLAREVMEEPAEEVRLNVSMTLSGTMSRVFVGTVTDPDGHQTVTVDPVEDKGEK